MTAGGWSSRLRCLAASSPSMPGMRMSSRMTSGACFCASAIASWPVAASPAYSQPSISSIRRFSRSRAGASSSTMRIFMRGEPQRDSVTVAAFLDRELRATGEGELEALSDVFQRDMISLVLLHVAACRHRVGDFDFNQPVMDAAGDADHAACGQRFDTVIDRVFQ